MPLEEDWGTGECGSCINFERTHKVKIHYTDGSSKKRWRGKCKRSGNLIGSWNISPCEGFEDNEESIQKKIANKTW